MLVLFTIAAGVAGVGAVGQTFVVLNQAMSNAQQSAQPAQIMLATSLFSDDDLLELLQELPEVSRAEAGRAKSFHRPVCKFILDT